MSGPEGLSVASVKAARQVNRGGTLTDGDLVDQIRKGDKPLFEAVMRRYNQRLFRLARSLLRDDSEAEDVLQDAYVRAYAHLDQLHDAERLGSWLSHIVVHESRARLRKRGRHRQLVDQAGKGVPMRIVPSASVDPEEQALNHQLGGVLVGAIDALPVGYRVVFVLRDVEGLSTAEVAESVGISEMAVKTRLHRARAALREELFSRIGAAALPPFSFDGERCDRIVNTVLSRI
jgi:RNA polymerase sigma-70 factor (ECF subfamily)